MKQAIAVEGRGLGAVAAAATLSALGHPVATDCGSSATPAPGPVVALNEKTLWMLGNLFGPDLLRELYAQGVELSCRRLRWSGPRVESVPERSLAIETGVLSARLARRFLPKRCSVDLIVRARGRQENCGVPVGALTAFVWSLPPTSVPGVVLWSATLSSAGAWIALTPKQDGGLVVQAFRYRGAPVVARQSAIEAVTALGLHIDEEVFGAATLLDAAPRFGNLWVGEICAMGDEAMALDPLAGDSIGSTIRSAVWLSALLDAEDMPLEARRRRYNWRMTLAFREHLRALEHFYQMTGFSTWMEHGRSLRSDC